ncbi:MULTISPECIES: enoyl-CoA hydratase/isomerase family protein [Haloarcula]|uniref:enoyl-CoA hydratase/isomerase family protein n=1 Tax=Haloarcula TaxID=2237 RepID=UPI0023EDBC78|nr:enoyl-CoA hydratase/isomerase family protein [Halomicroarcula sp. XH51]
MPLVTHDIDGDVATVTIDRPDKLNALNADVLRELEDAFEAVEGEARAVLLRTAGDRAFVAGADIKLFDELGSQTEFMEFIRLQNRVNDYVEAHPALVVSVVDALAYGGGFELVLATDLVVADAEAEFGLPEVNLGFVPGGGGTQRLPRVVGPNVAKEMIVTGNPITAEEGRELGLVNRVVDDGDVEGAARELVDDAMAKAPLAVEEGLRLVDEGMDASLDTALQYEQAVTAYLYTTEDNAEGLRAFNEKRDPEFEGQ